MQAAFELTQSLKTARGKRYYDILKSIRDLVAPDLTTDVEAIKQHHGKLTVVLVGVLALHYDVNFKAMLELLEWIVRIPCCQYDRIITDGGLKVRDIFEAARTIEGPVKPISRYDEVAQRGQTEVAAQRQVT